MEDQHAFDEVFGQIVFDLSVDDVIEKLADVGVKIGPRQRPVVEQWLTGIGGDTRIPLSWRIARLKALL